LVGMDHAAATARGVVEVAELAPLSADCVGGGGGGDAPWAPVTVDAARLPAGS
jgi:hypothetical protein